MLCDKCLRIDFQDKVSFVCVFLSLTLLICALKTVNFFQFKSKYNDPTLVGKF